MSSSLMDLPMLLIINNYPDKNLSAIALRSKCGCSSVSGKDNANRRTVSIDTIESTK